MKADKQEMWVEIRRRLRLNKQPQSIVKNYINQIDMGAKS